MAFRLLMRAPQCAHRLCLTGYARNVLGGVNNNYIRMIRYVLFIMWWMVRRGKSKLMGVGCDKNHQILFMAIFFSSIFRLFYAFNCSWDVRLSNGYIAFIIICIEKMIQNVRLKWMKLACKPSSRSFIIHIYFPLASFTKTK